MLQMISLYGIIILLCIISPCYGTRKCTDENKYECEIESERCKINSWYNNSIMCDCFEKAAECYENYGCFKHQTIIDDIKYQCDIYNCSNCDYECTCLPDWFRNIIIPIFVILGFTFGFVGLPIIYILCYNNRSYHKYRPSPNNIKLKDIKDDDTTVKSGGNIMGDEN